MIRIVIALVFTLLLPVYNTFAAECTLPLYDSLVVEGKSAVEGREWDNSVKIYSRILDDCRSLVSDSDLAKAYDALAVGQLMKENYSAAIDSAKRCLEQESKYNACMMTAAKAYEGLGDRGMALEYGRAAAAVEVYDDYSAAVAIYAKDYLKKFEKH